ncbi:PA2779 family protein [Noviherbaspirillum sp. ST9]|uniref:PA2779 family protein n=1 Tax=Noviherbaspirillum sp. ST9 TaxID=3401606 RepID=UPI003B586500
MMQSMKRAFVGALLATFSFVGFTQTVQAAMIGTEQVHAANLARSDHARINAALDRPEVIAHLERMGVSREDAQTRVAALSDQEAGVLASQIDGLPAGGDVVGALVLIFVVLLVTDILGLTKVFPFTRSRR